MPSGSFGGRYVSRSYARSDSLMPPGVKWLLIINCALFVVYFFAAGTPLGSWFVPFWLRPRWIVEGFAIWQLFTYMFLHSPVDFQHIIWNMLPLWMFGRTLEATWGTRRFLQYYFVCGVGAGICAVILNLLWGAANSATIGASGAVYGLLLAFGVLFPEQEVLMSFLFPIKAKYMVAFVAAMTFMLTYRQSGDGVSHVAHLGGMIVGYIYLKSPGLERIDMLAPFTGWYRRWQQERAKKKFQVYLRKQNDRDRMVH